MLKSLWIAYKLLRLLTQPHFWAFALIGILCWATWNQIVKLSIWHRKIMPKVILTLKNSKSRWKNRRQKHKRIE